jgi:hypothetical protein
MDRTGGDLLSFLQYFPSVEDLEISWSQLYQTILPELSLKTTHDPIAELPQLRRLQLSLHQRMGIAKDGICQAIQELLSLFNHLPLGHVQHLGVYFEELVYSDAMEEYLEQLVLTMNVMRFAALRTFHLGFTFEVFGLPVGDPWVSYRTYTSQS